MEPCSGAGTTVVIILAEWLIAGRVNAGMLVLALLLAFLDLLQPRLLQLVLGWDSAAGGLLTLAKAHTTHLGRILVAPLIALGLLASNGVAGGGLELKVLTPLVFVASALHLSLLGFLLPHKVKLTAISLLLGGNTIAAHLLAVGHISGKLLLV